MPQQSLELQVMAENVVYDLDMSNKTEETGATDDTSATGDQSHEAQIRAALNQQTIIQYRQYAVEKHPKDPTKQEELIRQLQEQHYHQYVTQIYKQQRLHQRQQYEQLQALRQQARQEGGEETVSIPKPEDGQPAIVEEDDDPDGVSRLTAELTNGICLRDAAIDSDDEGEDGFGGQYPQIVPASMWTRRDIAEFKQEILSKHRECCIKVGSLATATIRVPTVPEGTSIFWEFATDYYDVGFGVYFEWNLTPGDMVTVHISESSDEEDEGEENESGGSTSGGSATNAAGETNDVEQGGRRQSKRDNRPPTDEIIPVYRRDSHEEVYCGSHRYPGKGVYLIKFDNSYSLWRSKWIYYRVYFIK